MSTIKCPPLFILSILFTSSSFVKNISIEFIGVLLRLFQSLSAFNNGLNLVINSSVHVEELYKLDKNSPEVNKNNYVVDEEISNAVEFDNVDFSYFNSKSNIFEKCFAATSGFFRKLRAMKPESHSSST